MGVISGAGAITIDRLGFGYREGRWVLRDCTASVAKGCVFAVLGANGCGKTTLLNLLLGNLKPREGHVQIAGNVAFVPQLFQVSFPYRVLDMVLMGRARHIGRFSLPDRKDEAIALESLDRLGLADLAERSFDELSGGQRQLVVFARALAGEADTLVFDEPTSALDLRNQDIVLEWTARLSRDDGLTVLFTTHHPHHALAVADHALLMFGQNIYACGPVDSVLSEDNLQALYGVPMKRISFEHQGRRMETMTPVFLSRQAY